MFVFDQLKKSDRTLQVISAGVLLGMVVLVAGLWWIQIVSSKQHEANRQKQMVRHVRVPAVRGKILDRNGNVLADNRPRYDVNVYFEELFSQSRFFYTNSVIPEFTNQNPGLKIARLPRAKKDPLVFEARYRAVSNLTFNISTAFQQPRILVRANFLRHLAKHPYVPYPILQNLTPKQVAIFSENFANLPGLELELKSVRIYPHTNAAAHILGFVREKKEIEDDSEISFSYMMPDYIGELGTEMAFDSLLRGKAGVKTVVINSTQYRQREEMSVPTESGQDIWLTIDLSLQQIVQRELGKAMLNTRGASVVMDTTNGDILAMASTPAFDPNIYLRSLTPEEITRLNDDLYRPVFNRATFGAYVPGSIFKIITAIACLEAGLNPMEEIDNPGYWQPTKYSKRINDTAAAGKYNFEDAFKRSSNTYFILSGLAAGLPKIVEVGKRFHLGESTRIPIRQEVPGTFPEPGKLQNWMNSTPNICIGQEITVTPLQMACMTAAIANGGKLFWPRIVSHSALQPGSSGQTTNFPPAQMREQIQLNPQHLEVVRHAMLADVEVFDGREGTGHLAYLPNFKIAGKTGTAEILVKGEKDQTTWFASYGPYENPRYAVIVMVESGQSGGKTCAPVARKIYEALHERNGVSSVVAKN